VRHRWSRRFKIYLAIAISALIALAIALKAGALPIR
jgi:hypothetical protein